MKSDAGTACWIFALCLGWSACFHHTRDWNSASRLLLTHSLVQNRSVEVTPFVALDGLLVRDPPTKDLSSPDRRRYFCDKPPGQSLVGAAWLTLFRGIGLADDHPIAADFENSRPERLSLRRTDQLLTIATSGVASAATCALLFLMLRRLGVGIVISLGTAFALEFASPWQVYGSLYYSHVLSGFFALLSLDRLVCANESQRRRAALGFMAGLCAGFAVVVEYSAATFVLSVCLVGVVAGFTGMIGQTNRDRGSAMPAMMFLMGGLGPAILLGWYHWSVTGDPFVPAYRYEIEPMFAAVHAKGGGIPLTSLQAGAIQGLLAGASIGLMVFAPLVVWAIPGLAAMFRQRPWLGGTVLLSTSSLITAIACFPNWNGGLSTGPRLLVSSLPLMFLAAGIGMQSASRWKFGRILLALTIPLIVAAAVLNIAMNAAGGRKPFEVSIGDFLHAMWAAPNREMHFGDWLLSSLGVQHDAPASLTVMLVLGVLSVAFIYRQANRQEV